MIEGEFGNFLRIGAEEDISSNTNSVEMRSPQPHVKTVTLDDTNGLELGVITGTFGGIAYVAGEYVIYKFKDGDVFLNGDWSTCLLSLTPAGELKKIGPLDFEVDNC